MLTFGRSEVRHLSLLFCRGLRDNVISEKPVVILGLRFGQVVVAEVTMKPFKRLFSFLHASVPAKCSSSCRVSSMSDQRIPAVPTAGASKPPIFVYATLEWVSATRLAFVYMCGQFKRERNRRWFPRLRNLACTRALRLPLPSDLRVISGALQTPVEYVDHFPTQRRSYLDYWPNDGVRSSRWLTDTTRDLAQAIQQLILPDRHRCSPPPAPKALYTTGGYSSRTS